MSSDWFVVLLVVALIVAAVWAWVRFLTWAVESCEVPAAPVANEEKPTPTELPDIRWRPYLTDSGVETVEDLHELDSLSAVDGIGTSRGRDVLNDLAEHFPLDGESRSHEGIEAVSIKDGPTVRL